MAAVPSCLTVASWARNPSFVAEAVGSSSVADPSFVAVEVPSFAAAVEASSVAEAVEASFAGPCLVVASFVAGPLGIVGAFAVASFLDFLAGAVVCGPGKSCLAC